MRIISKFHDYYDTVLVHGSDPTVVYDRNERETEYDKKVFGIIDKFINFAAPSDVYMEVIGFCGKFYLQCDIYTYDYNTMCSKYNRCRTVEDIQEVYAGTKELDRFNDPAKYRRNSTIVYHFTAQHFQQAIDDISKIRNNDIFRHLKSPCFYIREKKKVSVNPILRDVGFYKHVDPYTAYQELSMYIPNFIIQPPEVIKLSDKSEIVKKGFDLKDSFRNTGNRMKNV